MKYPRYPDGGVVAPVALTRFEPTAEERASIANWIHANTPGQCAGCSGEITIGERICESPTMGWWHRDCAIDETSPRPYVSNWAKDIIKFIDDGHSTSNDRKAIQRAISDAYDQEAN